MLRDFSKLITFDLKISEGDNLLKAPMRVSSGLLRATSSLDMIPIRGDVSVGSTSVATVFSKLRKYSLMSRKLFCVRSVWSRRSALVPISPNTGNSSLQF